MVCALMGMEASVVSHYDGGTATAEAALMAVHLAREPRTKVVMSPTVHPQYREITRTYFENSGLTLAGDDLPYDTVDDLGEAVDAQTACLVVQNPTSSAGSTPPTRCRRWPTARTRRGRSSSSSPARSAWAWSSRRVGMARTSPWEKVSRWATRRPSAGRSSACSPRRWNSCAEPPAASWA